MNTIISTYLCPSSSRHQAQRGLDSRLLDLNKNGVYDPGSGDGMACIDYMGVEGPGVNVVNGATGQQYGANRGILLNLDSGGPCYGTPYECTAKTISVRSITDGTSHTMMVCENSGRGVADSNGDLAGGEDVKSLDGAWASNNNVGKIKLWVGDTTYPNISAINPPPEINWKEEEMFSDHPGGVNILMCDASVHFLTEGTDSNVYLAFCSRDGNEVIANDVLTK